MMLPTVFRPIITFVVNWLLTIKTLSLFAKKALQFAHSALVDGKPVCVCLFVCVCARARARVCMYVCVCVCVCVCV